ncbi:DUF2306 domain-containing protein [Pseudoduganella ginsengisoli]|uniref:DUF2306 domain-containing protein n=1 Tax=Pseudoduganella ginsengisoli TaxID=1462440 RepID=A0A6L6PT06_9BURK|nr:DUF2306 domain-containing protein [Pseudoduganella ginsengisoli]MTW00663.1 DUF2306 domain-containing protein [Pseudoduganella ginsengisoli]
MSTVLSPGQPATDYLSLQSASRLLQQAVRLWCGVAIAGQWLFAYYAVAFYGGALVRGMPQDWNKVLPHGYVAGDTAGNVALGAHMLLAAVVMLCGALQLMPCVRSVAPRVHRWSGRIYVTLAVIGSLTGLYMVWFRSEAGHAVQHTGISIAAVLILFSAAMVVHHARRRQLNEHRRWALRLFLVVSAVWFFRVGLMFWVFVNKGPAGFDPKTFTGPFLDFLSFAQFLVPLAVLELYLRVQAHGGVAARLAMSLLMLVLTGAMAIGIGVAAMGMWLPRL